MNKFVLTFADTQSAMKEEETLKKKGYFIKTIPTPRAISSECGFSLKLESEADNITEKLTENTNLIDKIYLIYTTERSKQYEEIYRR